MAIVGSEVLVIGVIGLIFLIFLLRPRAITDLARSMGQVVSEFKKGKQDQGRPGDTDNLLVDTAEKLGIRTEGKNASQIREEILAKAGRNAN